MYLVQSGRPAAACSALPGQPGPILANGVEFRFTVGYLLNSFFGRFWHAKMKKRSKLLNPRAAAWHSLANAKLGESFTLHI